MSLGLRLLTGNGLTAAPDNLSPDVGMKWTILYAVLNLYAGSGTGTRQLLLYYSPYNQGPTGVPNGLWLVNTGSVSGSAVSQGGIVNAANTSLTLWNGFPVLQHTGVLSFDVTLLAGDSFNYTILVDEEADF